MALADFCPFLHNTVTPLNLPNNKKAFAECYQVPYKKAMADCWWQVRVRIF